MPASLCRADSRPTTSGHVSTASFPRNCWLFFMALFQESFSPVSSSIAILSPSPRSSNRAAALPRATAHRDSPPQGCPRMPASIRLIQCRRTRYIQPNSISTSPHTTIPQSLLLGRTLAGPTRAPSTFRLFLPAALHKHGFPRLHSALPIRYKAAVQSVRQEIPACPSSAQSFRNSSRAAPHIPRLAGKKAHLLPLYSPGDRTSEPTADTPYSLETHSLGHSEHGVPL